ALGVALRAEVIEIYTDVDGVKTADPALVEDARTLRVLTYEEALHMALEGARVIHPRAVDLAMRGNVPIRVRPTRGDGPGTLICHSYESSRRWLDGHGRHAVTSVAQAGGVAQVIVHTEPSANGRADLEIFQLLAQEGIGVDMVNVLPDRKAFAVREEDAERARKLLEGKGYGVSVRTSCAKVSLVGAGLDGRTGVMAQVVQVLHRSGVPILQTADSRTTISCLVPREALPTAVRALHAHFGLGDGKGLVQ
ncbi:MAG: ACT domain-containing protein, partial [Clostridia bacterium]|nr:ACT domain-containing protein [Clostridia bacterium]